MVVTPRCLRVVLLGLVLGATAVPVSSAAPFLPGDFVTYDQDAWGGYPAPGVASQLLVDHFMSHYGGGVELGVSGSGGYSMIFTSAAAVLNYLPSSASPAALTKDEIDPTSTPSGLLGGYVLGLQLNVDFTDAGFFGGDAGIPLGDLVLAGLVLTPELNGMTVRELLAEANRRLGGQPGVASYDDVTALLQDVSRAFVDGVPTAFAQDHLIAPDRAVPEPATAALVALGLAGAIARRVGRRGRNRANYVAVTRRGSRTAFLLLAVSAVAARNSVAAPFAAGDFITYSQDAWGDVPAPGSASALLADLAYYGGAVQVGVSGTDHSMIFTSVAAVVNYLPASGPPGSRSAI